MWYVLIRAARYLGVQPWKLRKKSVKWRNYAVAAESSELWAEAQKNKKAVQAARAAKRPRGGV